MRGILLAASAALLWGSVPVASKVVLRDISPMLLAFIRLSLASIFLLAFQKISNKRYKKATRHEWMLFTIGAIGISANYLLYNLGLSLTSAISTQLVIQSATVFLVVASVVLLGESLTKRKAIATASAILGVLVVIWNGHEISALISMRSFLGDFLVVLAAISFSFFTLIQKALRKEYSSYQLVSYIFTLASLILLPIALPDIAQILSAGPKTLLLALYLAIIGTGLSYILYVSSLKHAPVSTVAAVILVGPFATVLLSKMLLAEQITAYAIFGGAVLLTSLYFVAR